MTDFLGGLLVVGFSVVMIGWPLWSMIRARK